jgi:flavin prenyltransferase
MDRTVLETHLVVSPWGARTIEHETSYRMAEVRALADVAYRPCDQSAAISSGSFITRGMVIAPCRPAELPMSLPAGQ